MISKKILFLLSFICFFAIVDNSSGSEDSCRLPDDAIFLEETIFKSLPPWYEAGVIWFQALTLSNQHSEVSDGKAKIIIDYVTVYETCNGSKEAILHEGYEADPPEGQWWGLYLRDPWFGGDDYHEPLEYEISNGYLTIQVSKWPDRVVHWWTDRFPAKQGCQYSMAISFKLQGDLSFQVGQDWWRDEQVGWNGWDPDCIDSNNCEAWTSDWWSSTNEDFLTITVPHNSYCEDVPQKNEIRKLNMVPIYELLLKNR